ncbi:MAG: hypothetical protein KAT58_11980 [candidate division Zixibacteria bacterium]|nr:hypothetical protein [candidate division Zixibacteria bacterium]
MERYKVILPMGKDASMCVIEYIVVRICGVGMADRIAIDIICMVDTFPRSHSEAILYVTTILLRA